MTTLEDRLAALADDAPAGGPEPGLWERGRRWQRRRRTGTLLVVGVACLALLALLGTAWHQATPPEPVRPAGSAPGLPDRIYAPSRWLRGTTDDPPGRLAAVIAAERGSLLGSERGVVGVAATTGEYRFLDLPDDAGEDVALSPDGRRVAYWLTGETSGSPNLQDGEQPAVGVGVWDATTGEVKRHAVATEHGLIPSTLAWADEERLLVEYGQFRGGEGDSLDAQSSSAPGRLSVWEVDRGSEVLPVVGTPESGTFATTTGGSRFVMSGDREADYVLVDLDDPGGTRPFRVSFNLAWYPVANPGGTRVAAIWGGPDPNSQKLPNKVAAGPLDGTGELTVVPKSGRSFEVVTWVDDDHVLVLRSGSRGGADEPLFDEIAYRLLDVASGQSEEVVRVADDVGHGTVQLAVDLLSRPTVPGVEPPTPLDPRVTGVLVGISLLGAAAAGVLWRRRVRP